MSLAIAVLNEKANGFDAVVERVGEFLFGGSLSVATALFGGLVRLEHNALHAVEEFGYRLYAVVAPCAAFGESESEH